MNMFKLFMNIIARIDKMGKTKVQAVANAKGKFEGFVSGDTAAERLTALKKLKKRGWSLYGQAFTFTTGYPGQQ